MLSNDIARRLGLVKYVVWHGHEALDAPGPLAPALALLAYHDAVEMLLRLVAEHLGAGLGPQTHLHEVIKAIKTPTGKQIPRTTFVNRLNQARIGFKHFGNAPHRPDVEGFRRDAESFAREMTSEFLGAAFDSVSVADLVRPRRAGNFIKKAEDLIVAGDFRGSIEASAKASELLFRRLRSHGSILRAISYNSAEYDTQRIPDHETKQAAIKLGKAIEEQGRILGVLLRGLDGPQYRRFVDLAPKAWVDHFRNIHTQPGGGSRDTTREDAEFCVRFVTDTAFRFEEGERSDGYPGRYANRRVRVMKAAAILAWPAIEGYPHPVEEICTAEVGEVLDAFAATTPDGHPGYVMILVDDSQAFIAADAIEEHGRGELE